MAKKSVKKNKRKYVSKAFRKRLWMLANFIIIMAAGIFFVVMGEVVGIAHVASNSIVDPDAEKIVFDLSVDVIRESNRVMTRSIVITMGIYSIVQILNYCLYLLKKDKLLTGCIISELIAFIIGVIFSGEGLIIGVPFICGLIYLRILKYDEE